MNFVRVKNCDTGQISVNVSSTKDVATDNAEEEVSSDADVKKALEQLLQRGLRALTLIGKAAKKSFFRSLNLSGGGWGVKRPKLLKLCMAYIYDHSKHKHFQFQLSDVLNPFSGWVGSTV